MGTNVAGRTLSYSLETFEERCIQMIEMELSSQFTDAWLVSLLSDAVRLKREYEDSGKVRPEGPQ